MKLNVLNKPVNRKWQGAGDVVALVARPIAQVLDAVAGTDLTNCPSCQERREQLNKMIPFGK